MKKLFWVLLIISFLFFGFCIFSSSPYRELRPYFLYDFMNSSREHNEINGKTIIYIPGNENTEPFYIDQRPVTIGEYKKYTTPNISTNHHYRDNYAKYFDVFLYSELPVSFILWDEARQYCLTMGGDLPTGNQWVLAAGGDTNGMDYAWGNAYPSLSRANFDGYYQFQTPSGWLPEGASEYGVLDLNGNVREWILDRSPYKKNEKSLKGASFQDSISDGRNDSVFYHDAASSGFNRGFRCAYPADLFGEP